MRRTRKGMVIKNPDTLSVVVELATRHLTIGPGEEIPISAEEVMDTVMREKLQVRAVSIVRAANPEEEAAVRQLLNAGAARNR